MPSERSKGEWMSSNTVQAVVAVVTIIGAAIGTYMISAQTDERTRVQVENLRSEMILIKTHEGRIVRLETTEVATERRVKNVEATMDRMSYELGRLNGTLSRIEGKLEVVLP